MSDAIAFPRKKPFTGATVFVTPDGKEHPTERAAEKYWAEVIQEQHLAHPRWTREAPTVPGFYYWRGGILKQYKGLAVEIVQVSKTVSGRLLAEGRQGGSYFPNGKGDGIAPSLAGGIWWGPLPEPGYPDPGLE